MSKQPINEPTIMKLGALDEIEGAKTYEKAREFIKELHLNTFNEFGRKLKLPYDADIYDDDELKDWLVNEAMRLEKKAEYNKGIRLRAIEKNNPIDETIKQLIISCLEKGMKEKDVIEYAGITKKDLTDYKFANPEFAKLMDRAKNNIKVKAYSNIAKNIERGNINDSKYMLDKYEREEAREDLSNKTVVITVEEKMKQLENMFQAPKNIIDAEYFEE